MGKGAWDCDARKAIPPEKEVRERRERESEEREEKRQSRRERRRGSRERKRRTEKKKPPLKKKTKKQAEVFEEIPTMDFPFHGIPTVPPRKDMTHLVSS